MNTKKLILLTCISLVANGSTPLYPVGGRLETIQNLFKDHTAPENNNRRRKEIYWTKKLTFGAGTVTGALVATVNTLKNLYQKKPILGTTKDKALVFGSLATSLFSGYKWYTLAPLLKKVHRPVQPEPAAAEQEQDDAKDTQQQEREAQEQAERARREARATHEAAERRAQEAAQLERDRRAAEAKVQAEAEEKKWRQEEAEELRQRQEREAKENADNEILFAARLAEAERQVAADGEHKEAKAHLAEFEAHKKLLQGILNQRRPAAEEALKLGAHPISFAAYEALVHADIAACKTYLDAWHQHADLSPAEKTATLEMCREILEHNSNIKPYEFHQHGFEYAAEFNALMEPFWKLQADLDAAQMALIGLNATDITRTRDLWHRLGATVTRETGHPAARTIQNFYAPHIDALQQAAALGNKLAQEHVGKLQGVYYVTMVKPD